MPDKNKFAFALYLNKTEVCAAVDALTHAGYPADRIWMRHPSETLAGEFSLRRRLRIQLAMAGAVVGTLVGAAIYGLTGSSPVGVHIIESSIAVGPMGILASVIAGGSLAGLMGSIKSIDRPRSVACKYQSRVQSSGYLVCVECKETAEKLLAEEIMKRAGAVDVSRTVELRDSYS